MQIRTNAAVNYARLCPIRVVRYIISTIQNVEYPIEAEHGQVFLPVSSWFLLPYNLFALI